MVFKKSVIFCAIIADLSTATGTIYGAF